MNITIRDPSIVADCEQAGLASELDLMALAVSRGCRHYAPMVKIGVGTGIEPAPPSEPDWRNYRLCRDRYRRYYAGFRTMPGSSRALL